MRKFLIGLVAVLLLALSVPALADTIPGDAVAKKSYVFNPGVGPGTAFPCAVVCAYWDVPTSIGAQACSQPFPGVEGVAGSYLTAKTPSVPAPPSGKVGILLATLDVSVDWDSYLCTDNAASTELAQGTNILGEPCDNLLGPNNLVPVGCHEDMSIPAETGKTYKFRVYNWSDVSPAEGETGVVFV